LIVLSLSLNTLHGAPSSLLTAEIDSRHLIESRQLSSNMNPDSEEAALAELG
jgi:hypothetical protein